MLVNLDEQRSSAAWQRQKKKPSEVFGPAAKNPVATSCPNTGDRSGDARTPQSHVCPPCQAPWRREQRCDLCQRSCDPRRLFPNGGRRRAPLSLQTVPVAVTQSPRALLESVSFFDVFSSCRPPPLLPFLDARISRRRGRPTLDLRGGA
ncbi:hypothetical protein HPB47_008565 [Ixodes persulcatus]|uniref:Uncharacterized protein n=1 Tax=Ixodes persulcatus TaxID=34615 RepID=A0AC60P4W7_IXOPE|nr:hypothetical protein HPB47_008565 [Ixodes persulcatus]